MEKKPGIHIQRQERGWMWIIRGKNGHVLGESKASYNTRDQVILGAEALFKAITLNGGDIFRFYDENGRVTF